MSSAELLEVIKTVVPEDKHDFSSDQNPSPMDTLGNLVDKLSTVAMKMWHNQELLYEIRRMTPEDFKTKYGNDLDTLHAVVKKCCDLNYQRNLLMDEIDKFLKQALDGSITGLLRPQHKTY